MKSVSTMWLLLTLVVVSAFGVMTIRHEHRIVFNQYHQALEQRDRYQMDWGRLMLEQATWATTTRISSIEQEAAQRLGMAHPDPERTVLIALNK